MKRVETCFITNYLLETLWPWFLGPLFSSLAGQSRWRRCQTFAGSCWVVAGTCQTFQKCTSRWSQNASLRESVPASLWFCENTAGTPEGCIFSQHIHKSIYKISITFFFFYFSQTSKTSCKCRIKDSHFCIKEKPTHHIIMIAIPNVHLSFWMQNLVVPGWGGWQLWFCLLQLAEAGPRLNLSHYLWCRPCRLWSSGLSPRNIDRHNE